MEVQYRKLFFPIYLTSLVAQTVTRLPTIQETQVQSLGQEDLLEKEMATHSSILAWKIPWMEEPSRLSFMGSQRVGHYWATSLLYIWKFVKDVMPSHLLILSCISCNKGILHNHSSNIKISKLIMTHCYHLILDPNQVLPNTSVISFIRKRSSSESCTVFSCHASLFSQFFLDLYSLGFLEDYRALIGCPSICVWLVFPDD